MFFVKRETEWMTQRKTGKQLNSQEDRNKKKYKSEKKRTQEETSKKKKAREDREVRNSHESSPFSRETLLSPPSESFCHFGRKLYFPALLFLIIPVSSHLLQARKESFALVSSSRLTDTQDLLLFFLFSFLSRYPLGL